MPGKEGFEKKFSDSGRPIGKQEGFSTFKPYESTAKLKMEHTTEEASTKSKLEWAQQQLADARRSGLLTEQLGDKAVQTEAGDRQADKTKLPDSPKKNTAQETRIVERSYRNFEDYQIRARL